MMMKISVLILATISINLLFDRATFDGVSASSVLNGASYLMKRSLCNTFGGCGSKRSLQSQFGNQMEQQRQQQQQQLGNIPLESASTATIDDKGSALMLNGQDASSNLVGEILHDLIDHLREDEKYERGKYVVVFPKQQSSDNNNNVFRLNSRVANDQQLAAAPAGPDGGSLKLQYSGRF